MTVVMKKDDSSELPSHRPFDAEEEAFIARHKAAQHAVQTAVRFEIESLGEAGEQTHHGARYLKHLRVGINTAMCDHAAMVEVLIDAGVIDRKKYLEKIAIVMEREKATLEAKHGLKFA
jgi:hypothetical protein